MISKFNVDDPGDNSNSRLYKHFADLMHESLVNAGPNEDPNG